MRLWTCCVCALIETVSTFYFVRNVNPLSLEASDSVSDWAVCHHSCLMMSYRTNAVIRDDLLEMAEMFPHIAMPFVIGNSRVCVGKQNTSV